MTSTKHPLALLGRTFLGALPLLAVANGIQAQTPEEVFVNLQDFGAKGNGSADDTAAFKAALAAARVPGSSSYADGNTILLPPGTYKVTGSIAIQDVRGLQLVGAGVGATTIVWSDKSGGGKGGSSAPAPGVFLLTGAQDCTFNGLRIVNASGAMLDTVFSVETDPASGNTSGANTWEHVVVDGGVAGVDKAFRFFSTNPDAAFGNENADHVLRSVQVSNYLTAAFCLEHSAVRNVRFDACHFLGAGRGRAGVSTSLGTIGGQQNYGGSFHWYGGGGSGNYAADFELGETLDTVLVRGGSFSNSARFLHTPGPSGNQWPIILESNVWLDDGMGTFPNCPWPAVEQMRVINFQFRGPLRVIGNQFGVPPGTLQGAQVAKPLEFIWNPGNNFGAFEFESNYMATSKANPFMGVTASGSSTGIYPTIQQANLVEPFDDGTSTVQQLGIHVTTLHWSATPSVSWLHTNRRLFKTGSGNPIANLLHGQVGQEIVVTGSNGGRTILASSSILLTGGADLFLEDGDVVTLAMFDPGVWTELHRAIN